MRYLKNKLDKFENLKDNFTVSDIDIDSISNVVNDLNNVDVTELKNDILDITSMLLIFLDIKKIYLVFYLFLKNKLNEICD